MSRESILKGVPINTSGNRLRQYRHQREGKSWPFATLERDGPLSGRLILSVDSGRNSLGPLSKAGFRGKKKKLKSTRDGSSGGAFRYEGGRTSSCLWTKA